MRRRVLALALALASCALSAPSAGAPAGATGVAPFTYRFRVVDFSLTATLTYASTAATIRYRLLKPSVEKQVVYLPPRTRSGVATPGWFAAPVLDVIADVTYTSPDPACTGTTFRYKPAGNKIVQLLVQLEPPRNVRRVSAGVGRIPLAEPRPEEDGTAPDFTTKPRPKCGKAVMGAWYQDAAVRAPASALTRPRLTIAGRHAEKFRDPGIESIEWSMKVVLQRLSYRRIDCATHPGC